MNFEKPSVVLCEDDKSALDLYNILISFYPQDDICYFPAHDSLPFSDEKSSKEILLERSFQLIKLQKKQIIPFGCVYVYSAAAKKSRGSGSRSIISF